MTLHSTTLIRVGRAVAGWSLVATAVGVAVTAAHGRWDFMLQDQEATNLVMAVGFGIVAWVALPGQPRNGAVWVLTLSAGFGALSIVGGSFAVAAAGNISAERLFELSPSQLPDAARFALPFFVWAPVPALGLVMTLGVLLFPDGRFGSRLSRAVGWASVTLVVLLCAAVVWLAHPASTIPLGAESGRYTGAARVLQPATIGLIAASGYATVTWARRLLSSTGELRQQHRWVLLGAATLVAGLTFVMFNGDFGSYSPVNAVVESGSVAVAVTTYGIAIVKYRLWDVDVVISKAIVYAVLAAFITAIYTLVAVGLGGLVGGSDVGLAILATALVAVAFEPARTRVQRWANRLVYGRRATPYEVLSDVTGTLATVETEQGLLQRVASMLAAGTGAHRSAVWVTDGEGFVTAATSPPGERRVVVHAGALPGTVQLVDHGGEVLGALTVETGRGDALGPPERSLMADLGGSTALVLRRFRLDAELQATARQLARSRRRLVTVQDVERRRLERDLRREVQRRVVALRADLEDARRLADEEAAERAAGIVGQLVHDADVAVEQIRSLAEGLFPPLLEAQGLPAALPALAELSPLDVRVDADVGRRHPLELEGAIYFCISEALTNTSKHGRGPVSVRVSDAGGRLLFDVTDSGPGFDPQRIATGAGLRNMADRLDTLGGRVTIASAPGASTTVSGVLAVAAAATSSEP